MAYEYAAIFYQNMPQIHEGGLIMSKENESTKIPGIYRMASGLYQGRFSINGKRYSLYDRDIKTLQQKIADAKYEAAHGIYTQGGSILMNTWFEEWLKIKEPMLKQSTRCLYINCYRRYIRPHLGGKLLIKIRAIDIQAVITSLQKRSLSVGTIHIVNTLLNNIFNLALKYDMITKNPCIGIILPKEEKKELGVLSLDGQKLFLQVIKGDYYEPLFLLMLATGLRIGEACALTWQDIDLNHQILYVNHTLLYQPDPDTGKSAPRLQTPKSLTSRRCVPLIDDLAEVLRLHRENQKRFIREYSLDMQIPTEFRSLVFMTKKGQPVKEPNIYQRLCRITARMNAIEESAARLEKRPRHIYPNITPHKLRHAFATRAFENGLAPKTVSDLLGHSDLSLTMNLYTHVTAEMKQKEMEKLTNLLKG